MINTLVVHKSKSLGIGCITKELKKSYRVSFGLYGKMTCGKVVVEPIDVSGCVTVTFDEFQRRVLSNNTKLNRCIVGNELKQYVGIGWITERVVTFDDLKKYPRVV